MDINWYELKELCGNALDDAISELSIGPYSKVYRALKAASHAADAMMANNLERIGWYEKRIKQLKKEIGG